MSFESPSAPAAPPVSETEPHEEAREATDNLTQLEAVYELENWARCPACRQDINTIGVVRMMRARVNFISTLPRRGHLAVCPQCRTILPAELGGLLA